MNIAYLCFLLGATIVLSSSKNVYGFDIFRELLFPRFPMVNKVRRVDEARAAGNQLTVLDTVGLIERFGYPAEEHKVTTEDGYNIAFFRIPGSPKSPPTRGKPVVFLQHGLLGSSDTWVFVGPDRDLAFLLADAGYDVWISNIRGNCYGRSHTDLSPQDRDFWNFSFNEMAMWDLPSMIDYALLLTGEKSLIYIGHSMGTTIAFILLSEKPEYNDKIRLVVALAPVAFWTGALSPLFRIGMKNANGVRKFLELNAVYELAPQNENNIRLGRAFCSQHSFTLSFCTSFLTLFAGDDPKQFNNTFFPDFFSYYPAGASTETVDHFMQTIETGVFHKYDLGYTENFRVYGKKKPPIYDVKKITAPVALIYGKNDLVSTESNTMELVKRLRNVVTFEAVPYDSFNHFDFVWAIDVKNLLYDRIMELMSAYSKSD